MKKLLSITLFLAFLGITNILAQPPGGGGRGERGGGPQGGPSMGMRDRGSSEDEKIILEHFPEIPDLTLEQREKVGTILTGERKDIGKEMQNKHKIEMELRQNEEMSEKEINKNKEKIEKADKKINEIKEKSDKKIKKVLSDEQYIVFKEKREEFKFKSQRQRPNRQMRDGDDSRSGERPSFSRGGDNDFPPDFE